MVVMENTDEEGKSKTTGQESQPSSMLDCVLFREGRKQSSSLGRRQFLTFSTCAFSIRYRRPVVDSSG